MSGESGTPAAGPVTDAVTDAVTEAIAACRYCLGPLTGARTVARERQFGIPGEYAYVACAACASLHLESPPTDLARFYPRAYYSLADAGDAPGWRARLRSAALRRTVTGRGMVARIAAWLSPPSVEALHAWLARAGVTRSSRILDVGSGRGTLLHAMAACGYADLTGVDPFLARDEHAGGVRLLRRSVESLDDGPYDLAMLHHSLEHVHDPAHTMAAVRRLLRPDGHALIRVPIVPSAAWERFGAHWVQLDAPRHLTIPSERGLARLAPRVGFELVAVEHDSRPVQFWASELYRRGETLHDGARAVSWFARRAGARRARRLNAERRGDQAVFLLRAV